MPGNRIRDKDQKKYLSFIIPGCHSHRSLRREGALIRQASSPEGGLLLFLRGWKPWACLDIEKRTDHVDESKWI